MTTVFRQLYDNVSSTYTYLLADGLTREALIIDPVYELHARDLALLRELGLRLTATLDTHCHADHVTGAWLMRQATGCRIGLSRSYGARNVDLPLEEGSRVTYGKGWLDVWSTPGHTDGCLSFVLHDRSMVFTGDCLMIRGAGRTDFQQGDARKMYRSIHDRLFALPEACAVYPAHDYDGRCSSTIGEEKLHNTRIGGGASERDFVGYMKNLNLPHPKKIAIALPANMRCGEPETGIYPSYAAWGPVEQSYDGIPQIAPEWVAAHPGRALIVDVRDAEERRGDPGSIPEALGLPLDELTKRMAEVPKDRPVIMVCRSGRRSAQATVLLRKSGYTDVASLKGGMLAWNNIAGRADN